MPYWNVIPQTLYHPCLAADWDWARRNDPMVYALAQVEAENTYAGWDVLQEHFEALQEVQPDGEDRYQPDPDHCPSQRVRTWRKVREVCSLADVSNLMRNPLALEGIEQGKVLAFIGDSLVEALDNEFLREKERMKGMKPPEFFRMDAQARARLAEAILSVMEAKEEIREEAAQRVRDGKEFPPPFEEAA